jgi:outer membrane protein assembly factor BamB
LLAVDKRTGETVWKTTRYGSRGWSTPVFQELPNGERELVVNGPGGIFAYDPRTGKVRWQCDRETMFGEPAVAFHQDLIYAVSGRPGPLLAIRRGGEGNVTDSHLVWQAERRSRDLSSPIVANDLLISVAMNGVAVCYNPQTGKELWKERLEGDFTASPIAADGKVYFLNRAGETVVLDPAEKLSIVARNPLPTEEGEDFLASPAVSRGQIFLRSDRALYAIGSER